MPSITFLPPLYTIGVNIAAPTAAFVATAVETPAIVVTPAAPSRVAPAEATIGAAITHTQTSLQNRY